MALTIPYQNKRSGLVLFDQVVNEEDFLEFLMEWSDSIVQPAEIMVSIPNNLFSTDSQQKNPHSFLDTQSSPVSTLSLTHSLAEWRTRKLTYPLNTPSHTLLRTPLAHLQHIISGKCNYRIISYSLCSVIQQQKKLQLTKFYSTVFTVLIFGVLTLKNNQQYFNLIEQPLIILNGNENTTYELFLKLIIILLFTKFFSG